jgi:hypothetical protein
MLQDDKPNNGLALRPNHHRAMDRYLIAPCPDGKHPAGIWRVGPALDSRIEGQKAWWRCMGSGCCRRWKRSFIRRGKV